MPPSGEGAQLAGRVAIHRRRDARPSSTVGRVTVGADHERATIGVASWTATSTGARPSSTLTGAPRHRVIDLAPTSHSADCRRSRRRPSLPLIKPTLRSTDLDSAGAGPSASPAAPHRRAAHPPHTETKVLGQLLLRAPRLAAPTHHPYERDRIRRPVECRRRPITRPSAWAPTQSPF
jgi:hypothetical protein